MGDITRNLSRYEFKCRCSRNCGLSDPHPRLVIGIQKVIDNSGATMTIITSGSRCDSHHRFLMRLGLAARYSRHLLRSPGDYSLAADCVFRGVLLSSVLREAEALPEFSNGGIGLYVRKTPRLHLDIRGVKARWGVVDGNKVSFARALQELNRREKIS